MHGPKNNQKKAKRLLKLENPSNFIGVISESFYASSEDFENAFGLYGIIYYLNN